jgi:hypothetical protein
MPLVNDSQEQIFPAPAPSGKVLNDYGQWVDVGGGGPHTHPESEVVSLVTDLAGKSFVDHDHDLYYALVDHTHPPSGGNGYVLNGAAANQATTTDAQTLYWGCMPSLAVTTTANNTRLYIPKAGTIKAAQVFLHAATAGTAEAWVMNIRKNNTTDTQIASLSLAAAQRLWANYALNIAVAAGDYIEIKEVCPTWATNPANVRRSCNIYVE